MKGLQAACPACAGPVRFQISTSLVTICPFCRSVVARGDRRLEDLGKLADLAETDSPLKLGLRGMYGGKRFVLVGRTQYKHSAGGVWDEWYAAFPGGRWGWLAEAQGRFYMTFERKPSEKKPLPDLDDLELETQVALDDKTTLTVAEVGQAETLSAEGEIPFRFEPGQAHDFADLYGPQGAFATLSFVDDGPTLFLGKEVTLDELGISLEAKGAEREPRQISALHVSCPQCGGPLTLHVPDKTERIACPNCQALLDCKQGNLSFLMTLVPGKHHPLIPLGTAGTFRGVSYTAIGFMARSVTFLGVDYFWTEYLLYSPRVGFRWLVESDHHWSFVQPVSAGAVHRSTDEASYEGRKFRKFQVAEATVRYVVGEFYWKVAVGEVVTAADYIAPPEMLSLELTEPSVTDDDQKRPRGPLEINCSLGTYVPHAEIEQAFGVTDLPRGFGVAPNQPRPIDRRVYAAWVGFAGLLIALDYGLSTIPAPRVVDSGYFLVSLALISIVPIGALLYGHSFEKSRWRDSAFNPYDMEEEDNKTGAAGVLLMLGSLGFSLLSAGNSDDD